jgi:glycosyltransferase involved in cell wall biosynthesis
VFVKIAVLWTTMSGYLNACLRALNEIPGTSLFVCYRRPGPDTPFDTAQFDWMPRTLTWEMSPDEDLLLCKLEEFKPDLILGAAYHVSAYRNVCRRFARKALRVYCTDNQWKGTLKQWLGVVTSPLYVRAFYDAIFVPGERQALWARQMGFHDDQIWHGCLSCDHPKFAAVHRTRSASGEPPNSFLFIGRLCAEKGVEILVHAYSEYRESSPDPWPLIIAGTGPLTAQVEGREGVIHKGFLQPCEMPALLESAGALVLPSTYEPWALVIHEAGAAGVPVICTAECGASVRLVQDGYSGYIVETGNANSLSRALTRFARLSDDRRRAMGEASYSLSLQFTPQRWAQYVHEKGTELAGQKLVPLELK